VSDQHTNLPTADWSPHDDLPAFALGLLDGEEQADFEDHLGECAACQAELAAQRRLTDLLLRSLPPVEPPAGARERLLARARAEGTASAATVVAATTVDPVSAPISESVRAQSDRPEVVQPDHLPQRPRRYRIRLATLSWAAALVFVLAAGIMFGAWSATGPHASPTLEILARLPGGHVLDLTGTGVPTARARLYVTADGRQAELVVAQLPQLQAGRTYQLWFAEPGQPTKTGGAFAVTPRGDAVAQVTIPAALERMRAVAVTEEAAPGSPSPTGPHLLDWAP
jgi:anti-sigma factor RsiW